MNVLEEKKNHFFTLINIYSISYFLTRNFVKNMISVNIPQTRLETSTYCTTKEIREIREIGKSDIGSPGTFVAHLSLPSFFSFFFFYYNFSTDLPFPSTLKKSEFQKN